MFILGRRVLCFVWGCIYFFLDIQNAAYPKQSCKALKNLLLKKGCLLMKLEQKGSHEADADSISIAETLE